MLTTNYGGPSSGPVPHRSWRIAVIPVYDPPVPLTSLPGPKKPVCRILARLYIRRMAPFIVDNVHIISITPDTGRYTKVTAAKGGIHAERWKSETGSAGSRARESTDRKLLSIEFGITGAFQEQVTFVLDAIRVKQPSSIQRLRPPTIIEN
ncbi:hypothetical protein J6590_086068 [Homalodisca vitripennis]|nr:hypothetical protein J6590_086068 [Homalodisca vitripennis]